MSSPRYHSTPGCQSSSDCSDDLDLFLDGELPPERESKVFLHLARCEACRRYLNSVLSLRRIMREESIEIPPWADDHLLARIDRQRKAGERSARLHESGPLWSTGATVSVRVAMVVMFLAVLSALLLTRPRGDDAVYVLVEQERVLFDERSNVDGTEVYVFYPGLTIEAERGP